MYRTAVIYKGIGLAPGSESKALYDEGPKSRAKLDSHLMELDRKARTLSGDLTCPASDQWNCKYCAQSRICAAPTMNKEEPNNAVQS